jgi:hypothetical protein
LSLAGPKSRANAVDDGQLVYIPAPVKRVISEGVTPIIEAMHGIGCPCSSDRGSPIGKSVGHYPSAGDEWKLRWKRSGFEMGLEKPLVSV